MKNKPLVSIITPSYNQGQFIEDTLLSVLNQDYPNIEHIVVDGGSTDETIQILKQYENKYNLKWTSEPDNGQTDAVNKGFIKAEGEFVGWINSDDVYYAKQTIGKIVNFFDNNPNTDITYGAGLYIDKNGLIQGLLNPIHSFSFNRLRRFQYFFQPSTFFRSNVVKNNQLDEKWNFSMDHEYFLRLASKGLKFQCCDMIVSGYRVHEDTKTSSEDEGLFIEDKNVKLLYDQKKNIIYYFYQFFDKLFLSYYNLKGVQLIKIIYSDKNKGNLAFKANLPAKSKLTLKQLKLSIPYYL